MTLGIVITLIILGIICVILEILVLPGGVVGIIGLLMMLGGIIAAFLQLGNTTGTIVLIVTLIVTIIGFFFALRSKSWRKLVLNTKIDSKMNEVDENKFTVGLEGIAVSRLAPTGNAKFGDEIIEVVSNHNFIDEKSIIVITKIEGNKITVKLK